MQLSQMLFHSFPDLKETKTKIQESHKNKSNTQM